MFRLSSVVFLFIASACAAAEPVGEQQGEALVTIARTHFAVQTATRSSGDASAPSARGLSEVRYDLPTGGRLAAYYLTPDGKLLKFFVNAPTSNPYLEINDRRRFIEKLMEIVVADSGSEERAWAAKQLDESWSERVRSLPVQVGGYVFSGITVQSPAGSHDNFRIIALDTGAVGLRYQPSR
jgi:hypothetical protein